MLSETDEVERSSGLIPPGRGVSR